MTFCIHSVDTRTRDVPFPSRLSGRRRRKSLSFCPSRHALWKGTRPHSFSFTIQEAISSLSYNLQASSIAQSSLLSPNSEPPKAPLISPAQSFISFTTQTAQSILRHYRAISHHKPLTIYTNTGRSVQLHDISEVSISESSSPDARSQEQRWKLPQIPGAAKYVPSEDALLVRCKDMELLKVRQLKTQDRNLLGAKDWWNGILPEWREGERRDYVMFFSEAELRRSGDALSAET